MSWYDAYPDIFKETLSSIFSKDFFSIYNQSQYTISSSGVYINIQVLESSLCIQNKKFEKDNTFPYLKNKKCADNVIIQKVKDNTYNMHIFELTRSPDKDNKDLMRQFEGACLRALATFSYFRNIKLNKVLLYFVIGIPKTDPIAIKPKISNNKMQKYDDKEIDNNTCISNQNKLIIKVLKYIDEYDIRNIDLKYEININKNINHIIL
ncbi:hypothetical protein [Brachyspira aalborgi]|uniref:Uncharacterized protein n=1 Tax=Brachyspira aalborgi TaxID=29522 RepID=A0A5C8CGM7_9SPIR|nr:hypothetical protein [Brachyspira aalborgi]TXJ10832.1 hypothetical protein EPJ80_12085 [Brachyspira aalborgi]